MQHVVAPLVALEQSGVGRRRRRFDVGVVVAARRRPASQRLFQRTRQPRRRHQPQQVSRFFSTSIRFRGLFHLQIQLELIFAINRHLLSLATFF